MDSNNDWTFVNHDKSTNNINMEEASESVPVSIPIFFRCRDVLVTGASGFLGRVLLEKMLRCCPEVGTVYVLVRPRKGLDPEERLAAFTNVPLFERLRTEQPDALSKVRAVAGDVMLPGLGLSEADAEMLAEHVSVVFHLAASVRFDDPLAKAVRINVCGTHALMELAVRMPLLKVLVHVSTCFCNTNQEVACEKLYPPPADWRSIVHLIENNDDNVVRILTDKILGEHRNTYTFTKALSEHVINEYADKIPVAIVRPSVVISSWCDPFPGWIDNLNGPVGLLVGAAKGIVHTAYCDPDAYVDYIPCDIAVKGLLIASWAQAHQGPGKLTVYQGAQSQVQRITQGEMLKIAIETGDELPFSEMFYNPCGGLTKCYFLFYLQFLFFQLLPAMFADAVLSAKGSKRMLVRIQRRIFSANKALSFFITRSWNFVNTRFQNLEKELLEEDREDFEYRFDAIEPKAMFAACTLGTRRYLLNEKDETIPLAKKKLWRFRMLHYTLKTLWYGAIIWFVVHLF